MKKAFTIIELLVVVAIIGILSAVVIFFVSEPGARASDSAVKANLLAIRKQSEIYYITKNTYGEQGSQNYPCTNSSPKNIFDDVTVQTALSEIRKNIGGQRTISCQVSIDGTAWALMVDGLKGEGTKWCVDSTGKASVPTNNPINGVCQ